MKIKPINATLDQVTIGDVETHKLISNEELDRDLVNMLKFDSSTNKNSFAGNPFLYHFQLPNLLKCKRQDGKTIYDIWNDSIAWKKLIEQTRKRNRGGRTAAGNVWECLRINLGSIVMFKSTTAKYLYQKYNATSVLDPTAGWGGRMLGAWALGIDYTGIDTNVEMEPAYCGMIEKLSGNSNLTMIWKDCLSVDFSKIDYDFVLTSPPYVNLELYEHMVPWNSDEEFYTKFLIPLWAKSVRGISNGGHICFNISPKMYDQALKYGLPNCHFEEDLKQQLGQKMNKKTQDKVYIWKKQ